MALFQGIFHVMIGILELTFLARAVLSWFQDGSGDFISTAYEVMYTFTEPLVMPVRMIFDRLRIARGLPIDLPFMITFILISLMGAIL